MDKTPTRLFFATITGRFPVDVIAIHSQTSYDALLTYCERNGISYLRTNEEDAAKMLASLDGIGFGCYTMLGADEADRERRKRIAVERKAFLANFIGSVMLCDPDELVFASVASNPTEVQAA